MNDTYLVFLEAITVFVGLLLLAGVGVGAWKVSGVPLNQYRTADCPDGVGRSGLTPTDVGLSWVEVIVRNSLGNFPAWFVSADPDVRSRKYAILVHGRGGSRASCLEVLGAFKAAGWSTLTITYRGDDGAAVSPDGLDHLGSTEWEEIAAAIELATTAGAHEICLYGRSAGGQIIGQYLKRGGPRAEKVTHVILDDPALNWAATFLYNKPAWMPRWAGKAILWVSSVRIGERMSTFDLASNPPARRPRTLILHGRRDEVVPFAESQRFFDALNAQWPMVLVDTNAHHGLSRVEDPDWYDTLVRVWLGDTPNDSEMHATRHMREAT